MPYANGINYITILHSDFITQSSTDNDACTHGTKHLKCTFEMSPGSFFRAQVHPSLMI